MEDEEILKTYKSIIEKTKSALDKNMSEFIFSVNRVILRLSIGKALRKRKFLSGLISRKENGRIYNVITKTMRKCVL